MKHSDTASATDALQKARELAGFCLGNAYPSDRNAPDEVWEIFPSIVSELERVTAENAKLRERVESQRTFLLELEEVLQGRSEEIGGKIGLHYEQTAKDITRFNQSEQ